MNAERISKLLDARPFKPFQILLNGVDDSIMVDDPQLARVEDDGQTLIVTDHRATATVRWTKMVDLTLVQAVQVREGKVP